MRRLERASASRSACGEEDGGSAQPMRKRCRWAFIHHPLFIQATLTKYNTQYWRLIILELKRSPIVRVCA